MINIDLQKEKADIAMPSTKGELNTLESEILYALGCYMIAKERIEKRSVAEDELTRDFRLKFQFAKLFFKSFNDDPTLHKEQHQ